MKVDKKMYKKKSTKAVVKGHLMLPVNTTLKSIYLPPKFCLDS